METVKCHNSKKEAVICTYVYTDKRLFVLTYVRKANTNPRPTPNPNRRCDALHRCDVLHGMIEPKISSSGIRTYAL